MLLEALGIFLGLIFAPIRPFPSIETWSTPGDAPLYEDRQYQLTPFQGKLYVFPYRPAFLSLAGEVYDSLLNRCVELGWTCHRQTKTSAVLVVQGEMYSVNETCPIHTEILNNSKYKAESSSRWQEVPTLGLNMVGNLTEMEHALWQSNVISMVVGRLHIRPTSNMYTKSAKRLNPATRTWEHCQSVSPSVRPSVSQTVSEAVSQAVSPSVCPSVIQSACSSVSQSVSQSVSEAVGQSVSQRCIHLLMLPSSVPSNLINH